jgi:CcmD family protein
MLVSLPSIRRFGVARSRLMGLAGLLVGALTLAAPLGAQATELGRQTLGRPYWHFFLAYAIVVVLIAGWAVSIARRLRRIEDRLPDLDG